MRQSAAQAGQKGRNGGAENTGGAADDAKIALFLSHGCGIGWVPGRAGGATFEGGLAADLLQVQRGEMFDSNFGCAESEGRVEFTFYLFRLLTVLRHIAGPAFFSGTLVWIVLTELLPAGWRGLPRRSW
jgi:hypothetical protein